jgi:hypothetical protein
VQLIAQTDLAVQVAETTSIKFSRHLVEADKADDELPPLQVKQQDRAHCNQLQ